MNNLLRCGILYGHNRPGELPPDILKVPFIPDDGIRHCPPNELELPLSVKVVTGSTHITHVRIKIAAIKLSHYTPVNTG